jgi:hypothetical protein
MSEIFSAALVGALIGTFFGGFTKFLWENWLPGWLTWRRTQRVERERELAYLRAPAILAFSALHGRLDTIAWSQASHYHYVKRIGRRDYYINSTAYLVACAFAWREILRRRMASYDYAALDVRLESLTGAFSHGEPGFQVFRLEQTEIGERMITAFDDDNVACMSFSDFLDRCEQEDPPRWLSELCKRATALLNHPDKELCRTARVDHALIEALVFLDPHRRWRPQIASKAINVSAIVEHWRKEGLITVERAEDLLVRCQPEEAAELTPRPAVGAATDPDKNVRSDSR